MFALLSIPTLALSAFSAVNGYVVPRKEAPATYATGYLEDYQVYHTRYLALGCQFQHNNQTFFNACCHPMLATETLETARPSWCIPSASASASASAAEPTSTVTTPADGDDSDDCDDGDDSDDEEDCDDGDDESSSSAVSSSSSAPTTIFATIATTSTHSEAPTTFSPSPKTSSTPASAPTTSSTPAPAPTTSSTPPPAPTTSSSSAQAASTSSSSSSGSGQLFQGGHGTFFYQNGVAGACGTVHSDWDSIVAIDSARYGNTGERSPLCGKTVQITANGKTETAVVADACPTCDNENSLDMSEGLFLKFADLSVGLLDIEWQFSN